MTPLKEDFKEMVRKMPEIEAERLILSLDEPPVTSVRLNKRKPGAIFEGSQPVKWCKSGLYLEERPEFIFDPLLHAGAYYVQDASSMIYETVVEDLISRFDSRFTDRLNILDLCAAPGGKTTAMINAVPDGVWVTANEYVQKRVGALKENLDKWGYPYVTVSNKDSKYFAGQGETFDIIAVDSPCSGEGMMRKEEIARTQWSPALVEQCSVLQREILANAEKALKSGGYLIYSTCTFNLTENEENARFIHEELGLTPIDLKFPEDWGITKGIDTNLPVYRFMPHITKGEGLFLSVFQKDGDWETSRQNHPTLENKVTYPTVDVDKTTALAYLRRESIKLREGSPLGMVTITYKELPLGEAKNIGTRANNLYPKNRRILKR